MDECIDFFKNKNILVISDIFPNASDDVISGKFVKNQINSLKKYFKNVYVIVPHPIYSKFVGSYGSSNDYCYDNVHVYYTRGMSIPLSYTSKFYIDFRYSGVLSVIVKNKLSFHMVHAHHSQPSGTIAFMLKHVFGVPYVLTIHENKSLFDEEVKIGNQRVIDSWRYADALIRVNPYDIDILMKYNTNSYYVANGYSSSFHPMDKNICRDTLNLPVGKIILFGLGILSERKGFQFLIESLSIIIHQYDVICYIAGDGPYRQNLQNIICQCHLEKNVILVGKLCDDELPLWMNACDLFVLPSLSEGNPTVMFEALACGKPFIGTNVGGIPAVINNSKYGSLCDPGNVCSLTEILIDSFNTKWDSDDIVSYSREYSWDSIVLQLLPIYYNVCLRHL